MPTSASWSGGARGACVILQRAMRRRSTRVAVACGLVLVIALAAFFFVRSRRSATTDSLRPLLPDATTWILVSHPRQAVSLLDHCKELPDSYRGIAFLASLGTALDGRLAAPPGTSLSLFASLGSLAFGNVNGGPWLLFAEIDDAAATAFFGAARSLERREQRDGAEIFAAARSNRAIASPLEQLASTLVPEGDYRLAYLASRHTLVLGPATDVAAVVATARTAPARAALAEPLAKLAQDSTVALLESKASGAGSAAGRLFLDNGALAAEAVIALEDKSQAAPRVEGKLTMPTSLPRDTVYFVTLERSWTQLFGRALLPPGAKNSSSMTKASGMTYVRSAAATTLVFDGSNESDAQKLGEELTLAIPNKAIDRRGALVAVTTSGAAPGEWVSTDFSARGIPSEAVAAAWVDGKTATAHGATRRADQTALVALSLGLVDAVSEMQSVAWAKRIPGGLAVHIDRALPLLVVAALPPPSEVPMAPGGSREPLKGPECESYAVAYEACMASAPDDKRQELRAGFDVLMETLAQLGSNDRSEARCARSRRELPRTCPKGEAGAPLPGAPAASSSGVSSAKRPPRRP